MGLFLIVVLPDHTHLLFMSCFVLCIFSVENYLILD